MASVRVKFKPSAVEGKEGVIYYQIIQNCVSRQLKTDYRIYSEEWDEIGGNILVKATERRNFLLSLNVYMKRDLKRLYVIIGRLDKLNIKYTADDVIRSFRNKTGEQSFFSFMKEIIIHLEQMGKLRTAENYSYTLNSFMQFRHYEDIFLSELDSDLIQLYEAYLLKKGIVRNTSSFYMRILRAVYNRALEKNLVEQQNLFKHVYTGVDKTVKRAISLSAIKRIKQLDLSMRPHWDFARDMFLFSFYTRGMSFIDMAYLKKNNLQNGYLFYRRRKTGQQLVVKWEKCMQEIVDKYPTSDLIPYLLPILKYPDQDTYKLYRNTMSSINRYLKVIARLSEISIPLSLYCARHSWASAAKDKNIPISVISEGMGHDSEITTQIYLASLDNSIVDKANAQILDDL